MKVTRIIAYCVIVASVGISALHAKSLRDGTTPTEFPPASYKGKQYVDSKGCIYIRAGIDGNVTWVPRVSRKRQQVCGYKPSLSAGQIASAPKVKPAGAGAPIQITVAPSAVTPSRPAAVAAPTKPRVSASAPAPVATVAPTPRPVPVRVTSAPTKRIARAAPEPLVFVNPPPGRVAATAPPSTPIASYTAQRSAPRPAPKLAPKPLVYVNPPATQVATVAAPRRPTTTNTARRSTPRSAPEPLIFVNPPAGKAPTASQTTTFVRRGTTPSTGPIPAAGTAKRSTTCPNASKFSQQFINSDDRFPVRCGPQAEPPVQYRGTTGRSSAVGTGSRIVPIHVYEKRQNTTNVQVASGYQKAWSDDRLNPNRAERTTAPAVIRQATRAPSGYKSAWDDGRLNTARATGSTGGDAQTDQIWTRKLPRTLIVSPVPADKQIIVLSSRNASKTVSRTSTRSAPKASGKPRYVRVATYSSDAGARSAVQKLAGRGLPMRLGTVTRSGKAYRVVLAGPFTSPAQANAALSKVRRAGFSKAKISK